MNEIDFSYPQFLKIDKQIKVDYLDQLVDKNGSSCFAGHEMGEVYLLAAALGFSSGVKEASRTSAEVRTYAKLGDDYKLLIRVIALGATNYDYETILDGSKTLKILEEYANAGLKILYEKIFKNGLSFSIEEEVGGLLDETFDAQNRGGIVLL